MNKFLNEIIGYIKKDDGICCIALLQRAHEECEKNEFELLVKNTINNCCLENNNVLASSIYDYLVSSNFLSNEDLRSLNKRIIDTKEEQVHLNILNQYLSDFNFKEAIVYYEKNKDSISKSSFDQGLNKLKAEISLRIVQEIMEPLATFQFKKAELLYAKYSDFITADKFNELLQIYNVKFEKNIDYLLSSYKFEEANSMILQYDEFYTHISQEKYDEKKQFYKLRQQEHDERQQSIYPWQQEEFFIHNENYIEELYAVRRSEDTEIDTGHTNLVNKDFDLNDEQLNVLNKIIESPGPVFVSGQGGTGKTHLLHALVKYLQKDYAVLAPTGIASVLINGQTIHSFFHFPPHILQLSDIEENEKYKHLSTIIIDEVSMVSSDVMNCIDATLQKSRGNTLPFGGVKTVLFGDLYQLPPVVKEEEAHRYLSDTFGGIYFFNAPVFIDKNIVFLKLNQVIRQSDARFKLMLSDIRLGRNIESTVREINSLAQKLPPREGVIMLTPSNKHAHEINSDRLAKLPGNVFTFVAQTTGRFNSEKFYPTDSFLNLKVGAQVLFVKNDRQGRWCNGSLGFVSKFEDGIVYVKVRGVEFNVDKETWERYEYKYDNRLKKLEKEIVGTFTQLPLRLAWAITIHKSQGQTYDAVSIDINRGAFTYGQTYVALSRCRSLDSLYLRYPLSIEDIMVDPLIQKFYSNYETQQ